MADRKLTLTASFVLKDEQLHARLIVRDQDGNALFDRIGRTAKLKAAALKKLPTDEQIIGMIEAEFDKGFGDIPFEKVKNYLE